MSDLVERLKKRAGKEAGSDLLETLEIIGTIVRLRAEVKSARLAALRECEQIADKTAADTNYEGSYRHGAVSVSNLISALIAQEEADG